MTGILYLLENKRILALVENVTWCSETDVIGPDASFKGVDLTKAAFCIIPSTSLSVGDTLGSFIDIRDQLPKTQEQEIAEMKQLIADLALIQMGG